MELLDKQKKATSIKIRDAASHGDLKENAENYYLLGPIEFELDLYPLVITYHSPFGQAILGKKIGENFTLEIRGKETKFTIPAIEKISAK